MSERVERTPEEIEQLSVQSVEIARRALKRAFAPQLDRIFFRDEIIGAGILGAEILKLLTQQATEPTSEPEGEQ